MAVVEELFEVDASVFIDDMLDYVYQHYHIASLSLLPIEQRNSFRQNAVYEFFSEIGDCVLIVLQQFFNIAENIIYYSLFFSMHLPNPYYYVANFIRNHSVASMTDHDFVECPSVWCSAFLNFLVITASLCIYFEKEGDPISVIHIIIAASELVARLLYGQTFWKMDKFKEYIRRYQSGAPLAQTFFYILD